MEKLHLFFKKAQKFIIFSALIIGAASFIYSLGFTTDLYQFYQYSDPRIQAFYAKGTELYVQVQDFNKLLFDLTFILFLISISFFIFFTQKRHFYYLSNYIISACYSGFSLIVSIVILSNVFSIRRDFLNVDFERLDEIAAEPISRSTFIFDIGVVLGFVLIVISVLVVLNCVFKYLANKKERAIIKSEDEQMALIQTVEAQNGI